MLRTGDERTPAGTASAQVKGCLAARPGWNHPQRPDRGQPIKLEEKNMKINSTLNGKSLTVALEGRLDTTTAPHLEAELKQSLEGITELAFDLTALEYISSAGLRVLLFAQKTMNRQGRMTVRGANETVMEVFEVTGFADILSIE